ncbi:MAG: hypothetical protein COV96_02005 [Candidatus Zambryskibacteria bacterium CG11_big_fil_rev_8_21_14_0_20_42_18]|uniref:PI3K/PI4K catalytic domain-containing protein n=1 Tax=Candidatus Zambryskibacteria bacterium CG_4_9_14_3_um_filter_42_15 TaxID=1975112 RepID=A0A2M7WT69_9BACT|nr:MAG: hypothetical protein COV96_02005 [Candidatus Zambryskibacteria bacterium CG11_big_fil_rev_8_21_14_0_20_42_18]PJA33192.1 MAG: hypothetical protein CO185_00215 [Candidatus Zambryskibacteria bacterium CG_4_9_14_3_um_filter_42_15]
MRKGFYKEKSVAPNEEFSLYEEELRVGEISRQPEKLPGHESVFIMGIKDKLAIYKPRRLEKIIPGWEKIKPGTYYKRERAAYLVSQHLDLDLVPLTVIRDLEGEHGLGSIQLFIPNAKTLGEWSPYKKPDKYSSKSQSRIEMMATLALFDILIHETDRHSGNALFNERVRLKDDEQFECQEKLYATDNGLSFGDARLRNFSILTDIGKIGWLCGEEIPQNVAEKFNNFVNSEQSIQNLKKTLEKEDLLAENESVALFTRVNYMRILLSSKHFPIASEITQNLASYLPNI